MYSAVSPTRVEIALNPNELRWGVVLDRLMTRFEVPYGVADSAVRSFHRRCTMFFPIDWFLRRNLSALDNEIALSVSEIVSADTFIMEQHFRRAIGVLPVGYRHRLLFEPGVRNEDGTQILGKCTPIIELEILSKRKAITSSFIALPLLTLLILCAVLTYLIFVQALLFGLAIFILLLRHPESVIIASTRHFTLGLGIIFFLLGFFGVFGATIRLAWSKVKKWRSRG